MSRRSLMRDRVGTEQRSTFLELFFDLVFVLAVTQLSHRLLLHLTAGNAAKTGLLMLVVWWAWIYTTWMANWFDPEAVAVRLVLLVGMVASLAMAIAIPQAFEGRALLFACGYVALQLVRNGFIVFVTEPVTPLHVAFRRILAWNAWVGVIWIVGALLHGGPRVAVWVVALLLDYAGPLAGYWTPGMGRTSASDWDLEHAHFAERFQLFVIIALGESIVTTGATAASLRHLTEPRVFALLLAFALAALLWWLYFDEVAQRSARDFEEADEARGELGRDAYTYMHIPIVAGIILTAVGAAVVIHSPEVRLSTGQLLALAAGPVLYLAGHIAFRARMIRSVSRKRIAAIVALVVAAVATRLAHAVGLLDSLVIVAVLAALAISETKGRLRVAAAEEPESPAVRSGAPDEA